MEEQGAADDASQLRGPSWQRAGGTWCATMTASSCRSTCAARSRLRAGLPSLPPLRSYNFRGGRLRYVLTQPDCCRVSTRRVIPFAMSSLLSLEAK